MPISRATIHHLRRVNDAAAELTLREQELIGNEQIEALFDALKSAFLGRISREHGSFSSETASPLAQALETLESGDQTLGAASAGLVRELEEAVNLHAVEIDVHNLFFVEEAVGRRLFYWFVAGQKSALAIDPHLDIARARPIDTGPSLFGIKVDMVEWRERGNYAYLSLLPPRGNPALTEAFQELTGFANGIDKAEATLAFLEGVEVFSEALPPEQANDYRQQVVDYCMEREENDAPVDLRELAGELDGVDGDDFVRVVAARHPDDEPVLRMDRRTLRRYVKFSGREKELAISFSSRQLHDRVHYDAETDSLSIRGLPVALRNQLLLHLKRD